ncbi:MAG: hypothetical protein IPM18_08305 [Phycisphaerales bacterium]|nr:hypothetical protein [Phycisphaerales bacterium]
MNKCMSLLWWHRCTSRFVGLLALSVGGLTLCGCETTGGGTASGGGLLGGSPAEEIWSIRCITLTGPQRHALADQYLEALRRVNGLRRNLVSVVHDDDGAHVFYGRYRRVYAPDGTPVGYEPDVSRDLRFIQELALQTSLAQEVLPFRLASMDVLPTFRSSHPEWNLEDADGHWSLHVAVFYNTHDFQTRRSAAEEYCRLLREAGEDAYFHHGTANSSVYIGTYPAGAVRTLREQDAFSGESRTRMVIVDERMRAAQQRFPESLQNGHRFSEVVTRRGRDGRMERITLPSPSFPVVIPKALQREE